MEGIPQRQGPSAKFLLGAVAALIAVILCLLNWQEVEIDFIVGETTAPLVFALLISILLGMVVGYTLARLRRDPREHD